MRQTQSARYRRPFAIAAAAVATLALASCSAPAADDGADDAPLQIAYISFAVANTYDEPMLAAAQEVAAANNAEITVFDGNLDPNLQVTLIQDAIASGQYDGIITQPIYGPTIIEVVKQAIEAEITVVNIDQILGEDFTTGAAQVDGLAANVVFVPSDLGTNSASRSLRRAHRRTSIPATSPTSTT